MLFILFLFTDSWGFAFVVLVAPNSCQVWQHQATPSRSGRIGWRGWLTCMRFSRQCCIAQIFLPINASYGYQCGNVQSNNESVTKTSFFSCKNTIVSTRTVCFRSKTSNLIVNGTINQFLGYSYFTIHITK